MEQRGLAEVLETVNSIYLIGTTEFYAKMNPDPWQKAHQVLDEAITRAAATKDYFDNIRIPLREFESRVKTLIENFRPFAAGSQMSLGNAADLGFHSNSEVDAAIKHATKTKTCAQCGGEPGVRIVKNQKTGKPAFVCTNCLPRKGAEKK